MELPFSYSYQEKEQPIHPTLTWISSIFFFVFLAHIKYRFLTGWTFLPGDLESASASNILPPPSPHGLFQWIQNLGWETLYPDSISLWYTDISVYVYRGHSLKLPAGATCYSLWSLLEFHSPVTLCFCFLSQGSVHGMTCTQLVTLSDLPPPKVVQGVIMILGI